MRQSHNKNGKGTLFNFGSSFSYDGVPKVSRRCAEGEPTVRRQCADGAPFLSKETT